MLSRIQTPQNKNELIRAIQELKNPSIKVIEIRSSKEKQIVVREVDAATRAGNLSVVLISTN